MAKSIFSFLILMVLFFVSSVQAEVTTPLISDGEYDDVIKGADGKNTCPLRVVRSGFLIRRKPNARGSEKHRGVCGKTLRASGISVVEPIGLDGNWLKFGHSSCPNGIGYVHRNSVNASDFEVYQSGRCGVAANYGYRNAPAAPAPERSTSVSVRGSNRHRFPLDTCRGIRSDRFGDGQYGARRGGGRRTHAGCDYKANTGDSLKSPCVGRITVSTRAGAAGEMIQINCDNGDRFKMMHLKNRTRVRAGTRVGVGTKVGEVGRTGNANVRGMQTHLHLEAYIRGRRVNPKGLWNCR